MDLTPLKAQNKCGPHDGPVNFAIWDVSYIVCAAAKEWFPWDNDNIREIIQI